MGKNLDHIAKRVFAVAKLSISARNERRDIRALLAAFGNNPRDKAFYIGIGKNAATSARPVIPVAPITPIMSFPLEVACFTVLETTLALPYAAEWQRN
jgi:hypothetical protein